MNEELRCRCGIDPAVRSREGLRVAYYLEPISDSLKPRNRRPGKRRDMGVLVGPRAAAGHVSQLGADSVTIARSDRFVLNPTSDQLKIPD